jgi:hypothetical protein
MAYLFTAASSQYLIGGSAPVTAEPLTLACWVRPTTTPTTHVPVSVSNVTTNARFMLVLVASNFQALRIDDASANVTAQSASGTNTAGVWLHGAAVFNPSGGSVIAYRNGIAGSALTNPGTTLTVNRMLIGARLASGSAGAFTNGDIAEVGVWSAALSADEIASLSTGFPCRLVRPSALRFYSRLIRNVMDLRNGLSLTNTNGATPSEHPRIIYPC